MSDYQVWNELGNVYIISGELEQAINAYKKALDLNPKSGWAHNNIALAYIRLAEPRKAVEHYQRSIELFDSFTDKAEAWHRLGNAYEMLGDIKNTLLAFERSTELAPEKNEYLSSLTSALEKLPDELQETDNEDIVQIETKTVPLDSRAISSIPDEIKSNLIPLETEESIDLDPGVEELMNELSRELEREVTEKLSAEGNLRAEAKAVKNPRWLEFDDDRDEFEDKTEVDFDGTKEVEINDNNEDEIKLEFDEADDSNELEEDDEDELEAEFKDEDELDDDFDDDEVELVDEDELNDDEELEDHDEDGEVELVDEDEFEFRDEDEFDDDEELEDDDDIVSQSVFAQQSSIEAEKEETTMQAIAENEPDDAMQNATVWGQLGNIFFDSDAYDGALIAYQKALELDGGYGAVMNNLALLHMQRGEYDKAIEFYQKSTDYLNDPAAQAISWNNLGNAYRALRDYDNAGEAYRKADELDIQNAVLDSRKCQGLLSTKPA